MERRLVQKMVHYGKYSVISFEKEKNIWPESSVLMDKMIATTKAADKKKSK